MRLSLAVLILLSLSFQWTYADDFSDFLDAAGLGNESKLKELIEKDSTIVNKKNSYGESALHLSSIKSNVKIVELLLDAGANPSAFTEGSYQGY
jgi:ankyrin repeat protein